MVIMLLGQHSAFIRCITLLGDEGQQKEEGEQESVSGKRWEEAKHAPDVDAHKWCNRPLEHKHEYIMHNANTTAPTLTCAIVAAVLSLVLSLGSLLKAVAIISNLQSLKSTNRPEKGQLERK